MRASVASLSKKVISTFFAATLALGLVPAAAFAVEEDTIIPANVSASRPDVVSNIIALDQNEDELVLDEFQEEYLDDALLSSEGEEPVEGNVAVDDNLSVAIPAAMERVNEDVALTAPIAQQESIRSYFLAQTLESTRTVPVVSAQLPIDTGIVDEADAPTEGAESFEEDGADSDESDREEIIAAESTVIGSFEQDGIVYAIEPSGESVALMAINTTKLPEEVAETHVLEIPFTASVDTIDYYSVTRIVDGAFANAAGIEAVVVPASVTEIEPDAFVGCETLESIEVMPDNPDYSSYDGCLYTVDHTSLLLIPEGRKGTVRIAPNVMEVGSEVFSHCPSDVTLVADAGSAASSVLADVDIRNANNDSIETIVTENVDDSLADFSFLEERSASAADGSGIKVKFLANPSKSLYRVYMHNHNGTTPISSLVDGATEAVTPPWTPALITKKIKLTSNILLLTGKQNSGDCLSTTADEQLRVGVGNANGGVTSAWLITKDSAGVWTGQALGSSDVSITSATAAQVYLNGYGNFTVTWNANGGTCSTATTTNVKPYDTSVVLPTPYRAGYTFAGWYTAADGGTKITSVQGAAATYYAHWDAYPGVRVKTYASASQIYRTYMHKHGQSSWWAGATEAVNTPWTAAMYAKSISLSSNRVTMTGQNPDADCLPYGDEQVRVGVNSSTTGVTSAWLATKNSAGTWTGKALGSSEVSLSSCAAASLYLNGYGAFTITWNANGGTCSTATTTNVKPYDTSVTFPTPTRTGYTFDGWYTKASGGTKVTSAQGAAATYYAHWTGNSIKLTWNSNGGSSVSATTQTYSDTAKVTLPTAPTRAGYTLKGWYTKASGGTQVTASTALPTSNTTYYAQWTANKIALTWDSNGGSAVKATSQTYADDAKVTLPTAPTRAGYTLKGWYTKASGGTQVTASTALPTSDTTYYAQWTGNKITLTWDSNGGSTVKATSQTYSDTAKVTLTTTVPTRAGFTFKGWYTSATNNTQVTSSTALPNKDTTYYAQWTGNSIAITWDSNGGSTVKATTQTFADDAKVTLPAAPTCEGYVFKGWFTSKTSTTQITASTALPNKATTYYAQWVKTPPPANFYSSTGSIWRYQSYANGNVVNANEFSTAAGYKPDYNALSLKLESGCVVMAGLKLSNAAECTYYIGTTSSGNTAVAGVTKAWVIGTSTNGTKTAFALGTAATSLDQYMTVDVYLNGYGSFDVSFDPNGGDGDIQIIKGVMPYDTSVSFPTPTRAGYIFEGWYTEADGGEKVATVGGAAAVYYAHWVAQASKVTYYAPQGSKAYRYAYKYSTGAYWTVNSYNFPYVPNAVASSFRLADDQVIMHAYYLDTLIHYDYFIGLEQTGDRAVGGVGSAWLVGTYPDGTYASFDIGSEPISSEGFIGLEVYLTPLGSSDKYGSFSVSFDPNGGDGSTITRTMMPHQNFTEIPEPTKEGHVFAGWFTSPTGGEYATEAGTTSTTLYAHWVYGQPRPVVYANAGSEVWRWIERVDNGAVYGKVRQYSFPYKPMLTVDAVRLGSGCLELRGANWSEGHDAIYYVGIQKVGTSSVGGVTSAWLVKGQSSGVKQGVALTTNWVSVSECSDVSIYLNSYGSFDITFDANGGNTDVEKIENMMPYGSWTAPSVTRTGYKFLGWYDGSGASAKRVCGAGEQGPVLGDTTTFYAHWEELADYTVNFNITMSGSVVVNKTYTDQKYESASFKSPSASAAAVRGYTLLGWSKTNPGTTTYETLPEDCFAPDANLTVKQLYGTAVPPQTCELFGVYKLGIYTVALNHEGGSFTDDALSGLEDELEPTGSVNDNGTLISYTVRTGTFDIPNSSGKSGYTFAGWKDGAETAVTRIDPSDASFELADRAYTAEWSTNAYAIKLEYKNALGKVVPAAFADASDAPTYDFDKALGDDYSVTLKDPYRKGYAFLGWSGPGIDDAPAKDPVIYPNRHIADIDTNNKLIYTAHWTPTDYKVTYDMNDGEYVASFDKDAFDNPETYQFDEAYVDPGDGSDKPTIELASPKRAGYTFAGWKVTKTDEPETVVFDSTYAIDRTCADDLTYTATWTPVVSATLPVTTPIDFVVDAATGQTQDMVDGVPRNVTISSSTAVPTELAVACIASENDAVTNLFDEQESGALNALIASLGFAYDLTDSQYVTTMAGTSKKLAFERAGGTAGPLTLAGSERDDIDDPNQVSPLSIVGPFSLVQKNGTAFEDLLIDLSKVRVKSPEELKAAGITGKTPLAQIVWTVSLPSSNE